MSTPYVRLDKNNAAVLLVDWRNDIEGLGTLFSNHLPESRNLITSYTTLKADK